MLGTFYKVNVRYVEINGMLGLKVNSYQGTGTYSIWRYLMYNIQYNNDNIKSEYRNWNGSGTYLYSVLFGKFRNYFL